MPSRKPKSAVSSAAADGPSQPDGQTRAVQPRAADTTDVGSRAAGQKDAGQKDALASTPRDIIFVHGASEDGQSLAVLRARDDRVESGIVRRVKEGEPIHGELLTLTPRPESPLLCDVTVELPAPASALRESARHQLSHGGPAQVATPSYRENWDAIWSKSKKHSAPN